MKAIIISGSQRPNSNTLKVAQHVKSLVEKRGQEASLISLAGAPLPLWDDSSGLTQIWTPYCERLAAADALIVMTPEWSGMVPAALKNFFLYCSARELGHKPALIVSVSSGLGGSYPVHELRTSSYKNTRLCYIPEHVIIRRVENFLADYSIESAEPTRIIKERLSYSLALLSTYATALTQVREAGLIDHSRFPNGM